MIRRYFISTGTPNVLMVLDPERPGSVHSLNGFSSSDYATLIGATTVGVYYNLIRPNFLESPGAWIEISREELDSRFGYGNARADTRLKTTHKLGAPKGKLP